MHYSKHMDKVSQEVINTLNLLPAYVLTCFIELRSGASLNSMYQRKQRALNSCDWEKYHNIGLAVELYKQTKLLQEKGVY